MVLFTTEEFEKAERLLADLLTTANEHEQTKILTLHDRLKTLYEAQTDRHAQLHYLRSLTGQTAR